MYKYRVSESGRVWLSDLSIQMRKPRLPGARGLSPVNQLFPLSKADKPGSEKPGLCVGWSGDLSITPSNHGLILLWGSYRLFFLSYAIEQLCLSTILKPRPKYQVGHQPPYPNKVPGILSISSLC